MSEAVQVIDVNDDYRIRIEHDDDAKSPKDWDNVGHITYNEKSRYILGTQAVSLDRYEEIARGIEKGSLIGLPVYAYVHGGSSIATESFSCPWDSGKSGWAYCSKERAIEKFGGKNLTKEVKDKALGALKSEVETYNQFLTGEVYGFKIEKILSRDDEGKVLQTKTVDYCGEIYGLDNCITQAKSAVEQMVGLDDVQEKKKSMRP